MPSNPQSHHQNANPKRNPNPKILSFILKAAIMVLVISFSLLFLAIAALAILPLRRRRRRPSAGAISPDHIPGLFIYTAGSQSQSEELCCAVCLEGYREGDTCRKLIGCCHVYHSMCVDTWLAKALSCPVCRTRVRLEREGGWEDGSKLLWSV